MSNRTTLIVLAAVALSLGVAAYRELRGGEPAAASTAPAEASPSGEMPTVASSTVAALRRARVHAPAAEPGDPFADPDLPAAPPLDPESGAQMHRAVAPGVQQCVAEALARHAELGGRLAVAYRVEARDGRLRVLDATPGIADETLAACIRQAAASTHIASPVPLDGVQEMTLFF